MRQDLDITDVEASTKIRAKYLRALENEEWGMLPGSTFVKSFLRTYAEALGLDPHLIVEEYRAHHEAPDDLELQPFATPTRPRREPRRMGPPPRGALLAVIVVGVLALLIALGREGDDGEGDDDGTPAPSTRTQPREQEREQERPARRPSRVTLRIVPDGDTYVCLDTGEDTEVLFEGIIAEPETFRGKRLRLNLGRRSVQLTANGRSVPVEPSADPAGFLFTPRNSRELPPGERPCT